MSQSSEEIFQRRIADLEAENARLRDSLEFVIADRKVLRDELYGPVRIDKPTTEEELIEVMKNHKPGSGVRLLEEIGILIGAVHPWKTELVDYPHALVRLNFCKVFDWTGELHMREGQSFAWQKLPVTVTPVLPGTVPVLAWFAAERRFTESIQVSSLNAT